MFAVMLNAFFSHQKGVMLISEPLCIFSLEWNVGNVPSVAVLGNEGGSSGQAKKHSAALCGTDGTFFCGKAASGEGRRC